MPRGVWIPPWIPVAKSNVTYSSSSLLWILPSLRITAPCHGATASLHPPHAAYKSLLHCHLCAEHLHCKSTLSSSIKSVDSSVPYKTTSSNHSLVKFHLTMWVSSEVIILNDHNEITALGGGRKSLCSRDLTQGLTNVVRFWFLPPTGFLLHLYACLWPFKHEEEIYWRH